MRRPPRQRFRHRRRGVPHPICGWSSEPLLGELSSRTSRTHMVIRDSLSICFYMRRPPQEVAPLVMRALERYFRETGPALGLYSDMDGYWHEAGMTWAGRPSKLPCERARGAPLGRITIRAQLRPRGARTGTGPPALAGAS